jgi:hypothetical protein
VIYRLENRLKAFRDDPTPGVSAPTIDQQTRKFDFLESVLRQHKNYQRDPENGRRHPWSQLRRIINGFLVEFINQSESNTQPLNIENDRNPLAKAY